jgi:glycosyltransferase involved in cell wall biosynthesis
MRIAVLCTDQGVRVPGDKGASLHLVAVARALVDLGHDVLLVGVAGHGSPPAGVRTHLLPHPGRAEGLVREGRKLALVERFVEDAGPVVRDFAPDVVHERLSLFGTAGHRIAGSCGAVHVVEVNALLAQEEARWRGLVQTDLAAERELETLRAADHVITVSAEWEQRVRRLLGPGASVATVPNGFDEDLVCRPLDPVAVRQRHGIPAEVSLAVFTGALRPWHGVETAVDAVARMPQDVHLAVAGGGELRAELAERARRLGAGHRVHLLGQLPHADAVDLVRAADVALAPYPRSDDFAFSPLKLMEYIGAGTPVVASAVGQVVAVLEEAGVGVLVTPGDAVDLARGIHEVLDDPCARRRARDAAEVLRRTCGWRARVAALVDGIPARPTRKVPTRCS